MQKIRKDNHGSALLMVVVGILFLGLLGASIGTATVMNARLKGGYVREQEAFYTADGILEELRAGLGIPSSEAASKAYKDCMAGYLEIRQGSDSLQAVFSEKYLEALRASLMAENDIEHYDIEKMKNLLKEENKKWLQISEGENGMKLSAEKSCLVLENIRVVYQGEQGEQSVLTTDICMTTPDLAEVERNRFTTEFFSYAFIGDSGVALENTVVEGSVYGGVAENSKVGISLTGTGALMGSRIQGGNIISRGELLAGSGASNALESTNIWLKNIRVEGSETGLFLHGNTNTADDIEINGEGNKVTLSGEYTGFGAETAQAEYSSAIMINGKRATVDLTGLKNLRLAGNSFVKRLGGAGEEADRAYFQENQDILLGSSLAVKSDQLVCFVPEKYVEDRKLPDGSHSYTLDWEKYAVYAGIAKEKEDLLNPVLQINPYYYRRFSAAGEDKPGCYYFLNFKNAEAAAEFYRLYAAANAKRMESSTRPYLAEGQAVSIGDMLYTSSGEILYRTGEEETLDWKPSNVTEANRNILKEACDKKAREYVSRQLSLTANAYTDQTRLPEDAPGLLTAFLDKEELEKRKQENPQLEKREYPGVEGAVYIAGADGVDTKDLESAKGMILSLGNVTVSTPFEGMILSFGKIEGKLQDLTKPVKANARLTESLLRAEAAECGDMAGAEAQKSFLMLFRGFDLQFLWKEEQKESVDLSQYITYQNWRKNKEE